MADDDRPHSDTGNAEVPGEAREAEGRSGPSGMARVLVLAVTTENAEITWQKTSTDIKQRDSTILANGFRADVKFIVGVEQEVIPCHRLYLAKSSSYLDALLFGDGTSNVPDEIHVPDVTPNAFKCILRYIYVGTLEVGGYLTAWQTLKAAKMLEMPDVFISKLRDYLTDKIDITKTWSYSMRSSMDRSSIWPSIQLAEDCGEQDLLLLAWEMVRNNTTDMLKLGNFVSISSEILEKLVKEAYINCVEIDLFNACIQWATAESTRRQLDPTPQNLRAILHNCLPYIRFLTIDAHTFSNGPALTGILNAAEINAIETRNAVNLRLLNLSCVNSVRSNENAESFYVCRERNIKLQKGKQLSSVDEDSQEYSRYNPITVTTFDNNYTYENEDSVLAFSIPTQIKQDGQNNETYEEDMTVFVMRNFDDSYYDHEEGDAVVTRVIRIKQVVPYNSILSHEFERAVCIYKPDIHYTFHVVFHKSGLYPKICNETELDDEGTFRSHEDVNIIEGGFFLLYYKFLPDLEIPRTRHPRRRPNDRYKRW